MSSIIGFLLALFAQLMVLPTSLQVQQQAALTTTEITTAQQQTQLYNAAQAWISANLTTVEATATATTPMVISVATIAAANVGLPASFSATNPFGQTWVVEVLQPSSQNLQVLVTSTGGTALTDLQAAGIAANVGTSGGFIPQNDSGVYPVGAAQAWGNQANWHVLTAGYQGLSAGHPAALLAMNNGQVQNDALYRVAVPGQSQLNTMSTTLNMGANSITNAATVTANNVVTAAGNGVQIGSSYYYGDTANSAIRQSGSLYIQNQAGTAAANIAQVGNINSSGTVTAAAAQINGAANIAGNTTMGANTEIYNPGTQYIETGGGNLYLKPFNAAGQTVVGGGGGSGQLVTTGRVYPGEYLQLNALASPGGGCSPNGLQGADSTGALNSCVSGVWVAAGAAAAGTVCGWADFDNAGDGGQGWANVTPCMGLIPGEQGCPPSYHLATTATISLHYEYACIKT